MSSLLSKRDYPVMTEVMTKGHLCWWQWQWFWSQKLKIWLLLILQHDLLTDKSQSFTKEDSHHHCLQIHYREKDSGTFWQVTWPVEPKARPLSGGQLKTGNQWSSWSLDSVWLDCSTFSFTVNRGRVCLVELLWSLKPTISREARDFRKWLLDRVWCCSSSTLSFAISQK